MNPYRSRNSSRFHLFSKTVSGTVLGSDSERYLNTWSGYGTDTFQVPVVKSYPVLHMQRRKNVGISVGNSVGNLAEFVW